MIKDIMRKFHFTFALAIRFSLVAAIISSVFTLRFGVLFVSSLAFILSFVPYFIEKKYDVDIPEELEFMIVAFIFGALFLGEVHDYYTRFWWWDIILHAGSGLALGLVGFLIMYTLYKSNKIKAMPSTIALFSFCFSLALGALWEIFEFTMDQSLGLNMQKSGLLDTMWDLIIDAVGALIASVIGYFYIRGRARLFHKMMVRFVKNNPRLFGKTK